MQRTYPRIAQELRTVPDDELLRRLAGLLAGSRHTEAAREHPVLLEMLADGRLHLSAIAKIAPHLTPENRDALLQRATHKTKREVDELVAELAPRPDVADSIRKLPAGRLVAPLGPTSRATPLPAEAGRQSGLPQEAVRQSARERPNAPRRPHAPIVPLPEWVDSSSSDGSRDPAPKPEVRWISAPASRFAAIEPLSPARYRVEFTASAELRDKLLRLHALMRSSLPDSDLASVVEAAVTEKLERLEARRFGRTALGQMTLETG